MKIFLSILLGLLIMAGDYSLLSPYGDICFLLAPVTVAAILIKKTYSDPKIEKEKLK